MLKQIDLSRADLNLLVLFEAVIEERNVARAARRLNLTPSAVSHGLGRLRRLLNDPLFLRTPKGVVPTARASELAAPIADVLARVRDVVAAAGPFDAATSRRRFRIGAPDGVSAVVLPALFETLRRAAPGVDVSVRPLLPAFSGPAPGWQQALDEIEQRAIDIAIVPMHDIPLRFSARTLYEEEFVIAMRAGHPLARQPTLDRYCAASHLLVSAAGDPEGFVDAALARLGRARRVVLTVPNFMMALEIVAKTDLIAALPGRLVAMQAARFGLATARSPVPLGRDPIRAVVSKAALGDAGVAWLLDLLAQERTMPGRKRGRPSKG